MARDGLSKQSRKYLDQFSGFGKSPEELASVLASAYEETGDLEEAEELTRRRLLEDLASPLVDRLNERESPSGPRPRGWASFDQWLRREDSTRG